MLPPGLENRPTHKYGELNITITAINIRNGDAMYAEVSLLGMRKGVKRQVSMARQSSFDFSIASNLWHFYAYLNDARALSIHFSDEEDKHYSS
jgi:hypothetical protein